MAEPMVVVDDLHVVYRVYGAGRDRGTAATALMRMVRRQRRASIREVHAIRGVSFVAYRGDAIGVIGRNGSGKSTLLRAMGMQPKEVRQRFQAIAEFSGVGDFVNLPMKTYSTGMGSRLRFAIASAKHQNILLIDEALATGDAEFRVRSQERIEELRRDAGTEFLVAHNLLHVEETCNRVIWLEKGQIVQAGEDVASIVDAYLAASGGQPIERTQPGVKR